MTTDYQTAHYQFRTLRAGATLTRVKDGANVYFRPGNSAVEAERNVRHCMDVPEMWPGENRSLFNKWASPYFS